MPQLPFFEVDVFTSAPFRGNPLAVVADADNLTAEQTQSIATWTNFSETTFLLSPTHAEADYRVRIFTPSGELPFAGHPTLGTVAVWNSLQSSKASKNILQECEAGLISIRCENGRFSFATPPRVKTGALSEGELAEVLERLNISEKDIVASEWGDNGPGWRLVQLANASAVRNLKPNSPTGSLRIGVVGLEEDSSPYAYEARAFNPRGEDPVTGSLHGALAQWMRERHQVPASYLAHQGSQVGRAGEIFSRTIQPIFGSVEMSLCVFKES